MHGSERTGKSLFLLGEKMGGLDARGHDESRHDAKEDGDDPFEDEDPPPAYEKR